MPPRKKVNTEENQPKKPTPKKRAPRKKAAPKKTVKEGQGADGKFTAGNKLGNKWKKGESGNPAGKQKKIYNVLKEKGYQKHDIKACFGELLFYEPDELEEIVTNSAAYPAITIIVAKAMMKAVKYGSMNQILSIIEYTIGKPTATANVNHSGLNLGVEYVDEED